MPWYDLKADCEHCGKRHTVLRRLAHEKDAPAGQEIPFGEFFEDRELPANVAKLFEGGPLFAQCPVTRMVFSVEGPVQLYLFSVEETAG